MLPRKEKKIKKKRAPRGSINNFLNGSKEEKTSKNHNQVLKTPKKESTEKSRKTTKNETSPKKYDPIGEIHSKSPIDFNGLGLEIDSLKETRKDGSKLSTVTYKISEDKGKEIALDIALEQIDDTIDFHYNELIPRFPETKEMINKYYGIK